MKGELPESWVEVPIGEIAQINPAPDRSPIDHDVDVSFLPMASVLPEHGGVSEPVNRPYREVSKGYTRFVEGDVLFAKITPCMENGKVTVARGLTNTMGCGSTEFHVLRARLGIDPGWISRYLWRSDIRHLAKSHMTGAVGQQRVPTDFFDDLVIPVAPSREQSRVIDELGALLTNIAEAEESLERVRRNLDRYRASVLKAACEGRLVPTEAELARREGRDYEPADKLLERILAARREAWEKAQLEAYEKKGRTPPKNWKSHYVEPQAPDTSDLPELPDGWCWATLDQVSASITSGSRDWSPYYGTGPGVFVLAQNVRMGKFDLTNVQLVNPPKDHRDRERSLIRRDDLLVTIVGAKTGDVCRVDLEVREHYVCQSVALLRPALPIISKYLEAYLCSALGGQAQFRLFTYGQGRPHLGFEQLQAVSIPLPPGPEIKSVVEQIGMLLTYHAHLLDCVTSSATRCRTLRQSLLKHAFSGKLVPQDPSEEPASVLLDRIRAQRHELESAAPSRQRAQRRKSPKSP